MTEIKTEFEFESILLNSPIASDLVELRGAVSILEIKEDIRYPFITADMTIRDEMGFVQGVNITGGETVTILLTSNRPDTVSIAKRFYISKIKMTAKTSDTAETYIFELIEDILYESNLQNVNKAYNGKCIDILQKISENYLGKELLTQEQAVQVLKLIVPNLTPLEAMMWIKDRASTLDGYPFYLFSSLVGDKLNFLDLGTMINQPSMNPKIPFRYWSAAVNTDYVDIQRRVLKGFEQTNSEDLYSLIRRGLIGAEYEFVDTLKNKRNQFQFDVFKDLLKPLVDNSVLPKKQNNILYGPNFKLNDKPFNELASKRITRMGGTSPYKVSDDTDVFGYRETNGIGEYKYEVISRAMADILVKAPITIVANGIDFLDGNNHRTIGNSISVEFLNSNMFDHSSDLIDTRLTGDYLIYGAHHMFRREINAYDIKLSCVKLANTSVNSR